MAARPGQPHTWSWPSLALLVVGAVVAASGVWFVAQWHSPALAFPGIDRVQYDAAWAFVFAGIALMLNVAGFVTAGRWGAVVPILLGGFRLATTVVPGAYGIRPMLANPWLPFGQGNYNEMGILSAALFVVLGAALIWARSRSYGPWRSVAVALLAAIAVALGTLLLVGAWTGGIVAAQWLQLAGGERSGAVLFLLLGGGILAHAVLGGEQERRAVGRWTPAIVGCAALICAIVLWHALALQETRYIQSATTLVAGSAKQRIEVALEQRMRTLQRLAERSQIYAFTETQFQQDAGGLLDDVAASPDLKMIAWTADDLTIRWLTRRGQTGTGAIEVRFEPLRSAPSESFAAKQAVITHFFEPASGERGVAIAAPAYADGALRGAIVGALAQNWLRGVLRDRFLDFDVNLLDAGDPISVVPGDSTPADAAWAQELPVEVANARWTLVVTPTRDYLRRSESALPESALALGVVLSVLLALCTLLFQTAQRRARALARTNMRLLDDIRARRQAEQALQESERRTGLILNAIKDCAIFMLDAKGGIVTWNPGAEQLTGYKLEEIIGRPFSILYPADGKIQPGNELALAARDGSAEVECWHLRKDGTRFLGDDDVSVMRDDAGRLQGYSVVTRDATHRVELREQTERSRDFYMALFSGFPNLVWRSDAAGRCDYLNQAWLDFTGRPRDSELGEGWLSGLHPDDQPLWRDALKRAFPKREPFEVEFRLRRANGEYGWIICNGRPYHDQSGRFAGYLCSCYDNTARRAVENALNESEERLERITSNLPGMVFKLQRGKDGQLAFLYVNPGCEVVTGLSEASLLASAASFFELVPAADRAHLMATLETSAAQLGNWNWSGRLYPVHESTEKWVTVRAKPRRAGRGITIWDGVVVDDTQIRLSQLELERSREDLRALSRHLQSVREEEKARIAREVHDELGSTLTALKMDLAWLGMKLERSSEEIKQKRGAMSNLVDAAVAATRKIVTDLRPSVLDDLGLAAALRWQASEFGRHAGARVRVDAPETNVDMSREIALTLFRIFQETLTNIARHAKATEVDVKLIANNGAFVLQIHDNGVGFNEGDLTKPTSHGIRGMRERARQFGGDVSVSSKPGGGTTLVITVPRSVA
jgi:two-component system, NarL family, sensor histidine kinase UhpB